jgi:hypothetical protein
VTNTCAIELGQKITLSRVVVNRTALGPVSSFRGSAEIREKVTRRRELLLLQEIYGDFWRWSLFYGFKLFPCASRMNVFCGYMLLFKAAEDSLLIGTHLKIARVYYWAAPFCKINCLQSPVPRCGVAREIKQVLLHKYYLFSK